LVDVTRACPRFLRVAKTHVGRVPAKLDCHDRAQLVALAYETGFVKPGEREHFAAEPAA
jgi:hypothetical protein